MEKNNTQKALPTLVKSSEILCWINDRNSIDNLVFANQINARKRTIDFEFVDGTPIVTIKEYHNIMLCHGNVSVATLS